MYAVGLDTSSSAYGLSLLAELASIGALLLSQVHFGLLEQMLAQGALTNNASIAGRGRYAVCALCRI
jgi:hypothetical protein